MAIEQNASTGVSRAHRYWRLLAQILGWAVVAAIGWLMWPTSLGGGSSFVIVSGRSMEPTYESGDLVIARDIAPAIGDVIVYAPETLGGAQVVHRIIGGDADSGWQVQGDNNDFVDPFFPSGDEVRGVVLVHIPNAGAVTSWLLNPLLWGAVILAALVIVIWPSSDNESQADHSIGADDAEAEDSVEADQARHDSGAQSQTDTNEVEV